MRFQDYDVAESLQDAEGLEVFLADAFESGDAGYIANAIGVAARAKGMTEVARSSGLAREQLYKSLSADGNPTLSTLLAVMKALGMELTGRRAGSGDRSAA